MSAANEPQPLYDPSTANPAYHLRYSWTGWPSRTGLPSNVSSLVEDATPYWELDGMRLLEHKVNRDSMQLAFSAKPHVAPVLLAARAKGRLDHAARVAGCPISFSRKVSLRSIGENTRDNVEQYIEKQVEKERFVDPAFAARMHRYSVADATVDLSQPAESARGRYWYNLHIVLVCDERGRMSDDGHLSLIRDRSITIAKKKGYAVSRLAVMPDHLHVALRGKIDESPAEICGAFQNNLAYALGQIRVWRDSFYVGTFGEYNMEAVRRNF
jgi:REP element-mobilizing transposase RayT